MENKLNKRGILDPRPCTFQIRRSPLCSNHFKTRNSRYKTHNSVNKNTPLVSNLNMRWENNKPTRESWTSFAFIDSQSFWSMSSKNLHFTLWWNSMEDYPQQTNQNWENLLLWVRVGQRVQLVYGHYQQSWSGPISKLIRTPTNIWPTSCINQGKCHSSWELVSKQDYQIIVSAVNLNKACFKCL